MDSKILMESILLVNTINNYLNSTDEEFYYEEILMEYKTALIRYIDKYFNTTLNDPNKVLEFLNDVNNRTKDKLNELNLYAKQYTSENEMYMDLLILITDYMDKSGYDEEKIEFWFKNSQDNRNKDARLYSIYKSLENLNFFERNGFNKNNEESGRTIKMVNPTKKNDDK